MTLMEFYRKVIENVGLHISSNDMVIPNEDDTTPIIREGKPLALPTREHLNSVYEKDDDGNLIVTKTLFNPLAEDIVKGDTSSLKAIKDFVESRLGFTIAGVGELLLMLAANKDLQGKTSLKINKFLSSITEAQNTGIKKLVDDKTIENWQKLFSNSIDTTTPFISIFLKKKSKYKGVEYNRLAVLNSGVYDELINADKDPTVLNVKLRNKDVTIFKLIFKYLLEDLDDNSTVVLGSNDQDSPAFISLFKLYLNIMDRCQSILKDLEGIDEELYDDLRIKYLLDSSILDNISVFKQELIQLPNDNDINRDMVQKSRLQMPTAQLNTQGPAKTVVTPQAQPVYQQPNAPYPTEIQPLQQPAVSSDPMSRVAFNNMFAQPQVAVQPQYYPQPQSELIPGYNGGNSLIPGYNPNIGYQPQSSINTGTTFVMPATNNMNYTPYGSPTPQPQGKWI